MSSWPRVGRCPDDVSAGTELVGVVPHADITGFDPDDDIGAAEQLSIPVDEFERRASTSVRSTILRAQIPGRDPPRGLGHTLLDEARQPTDLHRAQRRVRLGH